jgi:23S rRNA (cytosine1962-C5)-methyltransferase
MGMLANRLQRVYRHLRKWARRTGVTCFRLYEKDIPEHPLIVDWYDGRVLVYAMHRKRDETPEAREAWLEAVEAEIKEGLAVNDERLFFKERYRRRGLEQYEKLAEERAEFIVEEQGHRFWVNLSDYHDTGLFLDHRNTRRMVEQQADGKRILNLFCYTGAFTVYAARGSARSTTSVDISNTYLDWARRNFELNELDRERNVLIRADVLQWVPRAVAARERFDLIVCDPPTFSNSKKMRDFFDVQAQHPEIINHCLRLLTPGGTLYFSTNYRGFDLREEALLSTRLEEITETTIPEDYRNRRIHRCWRISPDEEAQDHDRNPPPLYRRAAAPAGVADARRRDAGRGAAPGS